MREDRLAPGGAATGHVLPLADTALMSQNGSFARLWRLRMTGGRFLREDSLAPGSAATGHVLPLADTATTPQNGSFARLWRLRMTGGRLLMGRILAPDDAETDFAQPPNTPPKPKAEGPGRRQRRQASYGGDRGCLHPRSAHTRHQTEHQTVLCVAQSHKSAASCGG